MMSPKKAKMLRKLELHIITITALHIYVLEEERINTNNSFFTRLALSLVSPADSQVI